MSTITFAMRLIAGCLVLCVTSCGDPPGKGRDAEAGYRDSASVIAALEKFHNEHGSYPAQLSELVPTYIDQLPSRWFGYYNGTNEFSLEFSYTGPGKNNCSYDSKSKTWSASGYY